MRIAADAELGGLFRRPFVGVHLASCSREQRDAASASVTAHVKELLRG